MKHILRIAAFPLLLFLASCSTGTDPGDCMSIECLPITYGFTIWEERFETDDSLLISYSASGLIEPHTGIVERYKRRYMVYLNEIPLWNPQNGGEGDSTQFYLGNQTDSMYVAPPGEYNVWNIFSDGDQVVYDSIRTPRDPITIISHQNGDTFDPDEDLVLRLGGDGTETAQFNMQFSVNTRDGFFNLDIDDVITVSDEIVIPASTFAEWSGEEFQLFIFWTQIHRNRFLNRRDESVSLNYTIRQQIFLSAQP